MLKRNHKISMIDLMNLFSNLISMKRELFSTSVLSEKEDFTKIHTLSARFKLSALLLAQEDQKISLVDKLSTAEQEMNHSRTSESTLEKVDNCCQLVTLSETETSPLT